MDITPFSFLILYICHSLWDVSLSQLVNLSILYFSRINFLFCFLTQYLPLAISYICIILLYLVGVFLLFLLYMFYCFHFIVTCIKCCEFLQMTALAMPHWLWIYVWIWTPFLVPKYVTDFYCYLFCQSFTFISDSKDLLTNHLLHTNKQSQYFVED